MDIDDRLQVNSKDGMTMLILRKTVIGDGGPERQTEEILTIMDRSGKRIRDPLKLPANTKEDEAWLIEFSELLNEIISRIRGW